jgi:hypothetical protein
MWYYKARIYSPMLGRFLQTDAVGYKDQVNLYAYVGNDPVDGRDPSGLCDINARRIPPEIGITRPGRGDLVPAGLSVVAGGLRDFIERLALSRGWNADAAWLTLCAMSEDTITLWRPVGPAELRLIEEAGMAAFPPRLPEQPIFYPVTTEDYAVKIARDWNVPQSGSGFVTRFRVRRDYLSRYEVQEAGGRAHREYWIPAEELGAFNAAIVGPIEVVRAFR